MTKIKGGQFMKVKFKSKLSRALSLLLAANITLTCATSNMAYAAKTSSVMGSDSYLQQADITVGSTYSFGGYNWIAAEASGNKVVLQSKGVTSGTWPGYKILGNNSCYGNSIDGRDISSYDSKTQNLYNSIKYAEYGASGLYLVSNSKAGSMTIGYQGSGYYWQALKDASINYSSFGADGSGAWLGTVYSSYVAWYVHSSGGVNGSNQFYSFVVAPAFNLDKSKVIVSGSKIVPFSSSTGITAVKSSIQSIEEGASVDISSIISGVTYTDGTAAGHNASYTVSCDKGNISGTTYTAPTDITSNNEKVTFTVTSTRNAEWKSSIQVNLAPKAAGKIEVLKGGNYPNEITSGDQIDFSKYITVTAKDASGNNDGNITDYDVTGEGFTGSGHVLTANTVTDTKTIALTVTARQTIGTVSYNGKTYGSKQDENAGKLTIKVKPGTVGYDDRNGWDVVVKLFCNTTT